MLFLTFLSACGWWEKHQACSAARDAEARGWASLESTLDASAATARKQADASLAAAEAVELALSAAGTGGTPGLDVNRAEMAQDAFTRASRGGGTERGLAQATWTDWSLRTQDQVAAADADIERARLATERLSLWAHAVSDSSLAVALTSARYEAAVREGPARATLTVALVTPPSPAPDEPGAKALAAAIDTALEAHAARSAGLKEAVSKAERLAFDVQRAGQTAAAASAAYPFLGFPPEAQVAQAAALAAEAASKRAADAASKLEAAVSAAKKEAAPTVPADVERTLAQALEFARASAATCE